MSPNIYNTPEYSGPNVGQIAEKELLTCSLDTALADAARLMREKGTSSIIIADGDALVGIWTEADCTRVDFSEPAFHQAPIKHFMSSPLYSVDADLPLIELSAQFHHKRVRHLVVKKNGRTIGLVSQTDAINNQGAEHYLQLRRVRSSYNTDVPILDSTTPVTHIAQIMRSKRLSAVYVKNVELGEVGIITERDLLGQILTGTVSDTAWELANYPLVSIDLDESLYGAYKSLVSLNIRHMAVTEDGNIVGILSLQNIMTEVEIAYISQLKDVIVERDSALKESQRNLYFAEQIIEASIHGIMITDGDGKILSVNPAFTRVTEYSIDDAIGQKPSLLSSGHHDKAFYQRMWQQIDDAGYWQGEIWNKRKSGTVYPSWVSIVTISKPGESKLYAAIFSDITERKLAEKRIKTLAYYDELTSLPNRRLLYDRLKVAQQTAHRQNKRMGVLFLDLDRFKQINDSLGHKVGDQLLVAAAERLESCVKEGDTVARLGGDEFVVLVTEIDSEEQAVRVAQRITRQLRKPFVIDGHELTTTTSVGIAIYPEDGNTEDELLKNADTAMYRAKDLGRNSFQLFTSSMNAKSLERMALQTALHKAIDNNEFYLVYQPQWDSLNAKVIGVEALIRWSHPDMGNISPASFIPLAEELGIIAELDAWVLEKACYQRKLWLDKHLEVGRMAVNVSAKHFIRGNLSQTVVDTLAKTNLPANLLELEITEGCVIEQLNEASAVLERLKSYGVRIALDDFGTGYSALNYLTQLPIDVLKIDASFVRRIPSQKNDSKLVASIIAMANVLKLNVLAEGVETEEQQAFLTDNGCNHIQGYLISRPLTPDVFESVIENNALAEEKEKKDRHHCRPTCLGSSK